MSNEKKPALHPAHKAFNKLQAIMQGNYVPNVIQKPSSSGGVGRLWNAYAQDSSLARKGVTGAEIAQVLCEKGFLKIWYQGTEIAAGTTIDKMPSFELLRTGKASYEAVKELPSRSDFFTMVGAKDEVRQVANG